MTDAPTTRLSDDHLARIDELPRRCAAIREQIRRVIVGQHEMVDHLLVALFCQGHTLIVGVPGLAKTLLVRTVAQCLDLHYQRIQFTPDMMPSDILGTELIQTDPATGERSLRFLPGPVFANLVLADEINRTPPKTQAALLEAMAERQVTIAGSTRQMELPFIVVATQNPIEQEGTYPLPEAQLDRFMLSLWMDYPSRAEERIIAGDAERIANAEVDVVFKREDFEAFRSVIAQVPVSEHVMDYAVDLVRASRPEENGGENGRENDRVTPFVSWGAGPRAGQFLILAAKCLAALEGQPTPSCEHIRRMAMPVLRHRIVPNYTAAAEGLSSRDLVERLIKTVREPSYE